MTIITDKEKVVLTDLSNMKSINREQKEVIKGILDKFHGNGACELYIDGAADLHSKSAGIGGVIFKDSQELITFSKPLYNKTNNESEYLALLEGLNISLELNIMNINIYADSELVVRQVNGVYKVKNYRMKVLHSDVINLLEKFNEWSLDHINRDNNQIADKLSKNGMRLARTNLLEK